METEVIAAIGAVGSALAVVLTSLRKRKDIDVEEMEARIRSLSRDADDCAERVANLRAELVKAEETIFQLRRTLAAHGIEVGGP